MIPHTQPCDPATHALCMDIANRCLHVIQACLREEEWNDARLEFYRICRELLDASEGGPQ